ncbi:uncharacterized protein M421DRAFT_9652 [Didymella exigua CBS 183.55]|uniref:Uncharacterized protein n=1 Tax=Didymella exigua CBS 183.55 TaxID=1150837 RepID=A0A6A5R6T0_9PLEO|nr:uncharacterized protein M421DRAFT_9652 [Didymella exigua CBS 183.55]KAF1923412.1 hypothetical protein M421DRAFT_9652 [Didymella exigua CBS 183.55]
MGVALSSKVVTGSERRARPELVQPGDREWVTVIQSICAAGYESHLNQEFKDYCLEN